MHASAMAADPGIVYWNGTTVDLMHRLRGARQDEGLEVFFTIDAGPHIKAFCQPADEGEVVDLLSDFEGVLDVHETVPGGPARLAGDHSSRGGATS